MINLTDKAYYYIMSIKPDDLCLQLSVVGGGCSGLSYKMEFVDYPMNQKTIYATRNLIIIIDPKSALFLKDVEVDYSDGLNGVGFTYTNPAAKRSCGCGTSFNV